MRYGLMLDTSLPIAGVAEQAAKARDAGFASAWSSQIFAYDALTLLALIGREVPGIDLGTAVVPVHPRHPVMLAAQALTVQAAISGRLTLGIGLSHQVVVEGMWGYPYDRPFTYMNEYVQALAPLLRGENVAFQGEMLKAVTMGPLEIETEVKPRLVLAALGPKMLELAGRMADGTATWMTGPGTIAAHVRPTLQRAAEEAGRPAPVIGVSLPICVTDEPDAAREHANKVFAIYGQLPSYRAMLDREGAGGPGDVAITGPEDSVIEQLQGLEAAGATEYVAAIYGNAEERERTYSLISSLSRQTSGQG